MLLVHGIVNDCIVTSPNNPSPFNQIVSPCHYAFQDHNLLLTWPSCWLPYFGIEILPLLQVNSELAYTVSLHRATDRNIPPLPLLKCLLLGLRSLYDANVAGALYILTGGTLSDISQCPLTIFEIFCICDHCYTFSPPDSPSEQSILWPGNSFSPEHALLVPHGPSLLMFSLCISCAMFPSFPVGIHCKDVPCP